MNEFENSSEKTLSLLTGDNPKQYPIPVSGGWAHQRRESFRLHSSVHNNGDIHSNKLLIKPHSRE